MEIPEDHPATSGWADTVWQDFVNLEFEVLHPSLSLASPPGSALLTASRLLVRQQMVAKLLETFSDSEAEKCYALMFPAEARHLILYMDINRSLSRSPTGRSVARL